MLHQFFSFHKEVIHKTVVLDYSKSQERLILDFFETLESRSIYINPKFKFSRKPIISLIQVVQFSRVWLKLWLFKWTNSFLHCL